jgi:hypothetical protein
LAATPLDISLEIFCRPATEVHLNGRTDRKVKALLLKAFYGDLSGIARARLSNTDRLSAIFLSAGAG